MELLEDRRPGPSTGRPESECVPRRNLQKEAEDTLKITDLIPSQDVPLAILERRIQKEKDLKKQSALRKEHDNIKKKRAEMKKTMEKIAGYSSSNKGPNALTENRPLTRLKDMKEVSEHFMKTFSEWHEGQDIGFVLSQEQVFVNLIESGVKVKNIKEAITRAQMEASECPANVNAVHH